MGGWFFRKEKLYDLVFWGFSCDVGALAGSQVQEDVDKQRRIHQSHELRYAKAGIKIRIIHRS